MRRNQFGLIGRTPAALLLAAVVAMPAGGASVQADEPTPDAERLARMRDQAVRREAAGPTGALTGEAPDTAAASGAVGEEAAAAEVAEPPIELPAIESLPLGAGADETPDLFENSEASADGGGLGDGWLMSTLAALGVVIALVFVLRWVLRRGGVGAVGAAKATHGSVVEVLSRTTIAPRSHVVLLRIGHRVLVCNDSPSGMRTLASVEDPEEVAELLRVVDASKPASMSQGFSGVMQRLSGQWAGREELVDLEEDDVDPADGPALDRARGAVSSVRGRLQALSGGGGVRA